MELEVAKNTFNSRLLRVSLSSNSAAIKQLLQQQSLSAIGLSGLVIATAHLPSRIELTPETIPMHRLSHDRYILYRSAIAFQLAPLLQLSPLEIAHQLITSFPTITQETSDEIGLDFTVEGLSPGWINFRLSDRGLATWLQQSIRECVLGTSKGSTSVADPPSKLNSTSPSKSLFSVQYAHARCCSLLRSAHWQNLIELRDSEFKTLEWQFIEPNPIPWLNEDEQAGLGQMSLRLVHPVEQRLIAQIIDVQDAISAPTHLNEVKLASALSSSFEEFYSHCRIWGEVKTQNPKLAQARLGLIGVTQLLLRSLLHNHLGIPAPVSL